MASLTMVPLRSRYPHMGRVTLRYPAPVIHTSYDPEELDAALRAVLNETPIHRSTTPQVDETASEAATAAEAGNGETTARKGGQAQ